MVKLISRVGPVLSRARLTERMLRVWIEAPELAADDPTPAQYVRMLFTPDGSAPIAPTHTGRGFDWPGGTRPLARNLTVAARTPEQGSVALDVVLHDEPTTLQRWAQSVEPGHVVATVGPGAGHRLDADASEWVLAGDESALPAIRTLIDGSPGVGRMKIVVEIEDASDRQDLAADPRVELTWLERRGASRGQPLVEHFAAWRPETADPEVWLAGEHGAMRAIRRRLREDLGLSRSRSVAVPYWRAGATQEDTDDRVAATMRRAQERSIPMATTQDVNELYLDQA